jgi:hypothetical protein
MTFRAPATWRSLGLVAASALVTIVVADLLLQLFSPPRRLSEVEDAIERYRASDPDILVLGSSHARTFEVVDQELHARTGGKRTMLAVPVEWGKLSAYAWVLQHRLKPLLEEADSHGVLRRHNLEEFILVTEWWDSTSLEEPAWSLPARAWSFRDFLEDFLRNGITDYNRNYITTRWNRMWTASILVQDRGHSRILTDLKDMFVAPDPQVRGASSALRTSKWRIMTEEGATRIANPDEMAALHQILDYMQDRGVQVRIVLYPRKPNTLTEKAKETTLRRFSETMMAIGKERGIPIHDWTTTSPLTDGDFMSDFDHVTKDANVKLARWMLDGEMSDLAGPVFANDSAGLNTHSTGLDGAFTLPAQHRQRSKEQKPPTPSAHSREKTL